MPVLRGARRTGSIRTQPLSVATACEEEIAPPMLAFRMRQCQTPSTTGSTLSAISLGSATPAPCHSLDGMVRRRVTVRGRVQGVGFRYAVAQAARSRGVAGWVRNRPDATVEAVFEGEPEAVESLVRLCRAGPRGAKVERADVADEAPEGLRRFEIH